MAVSLMTTVEHLTLFSKLFLFAVGVEYSGFKDSERGHASSGQSAIERLHRVRICAENI